ncbi:NAD(P)/FAD-dependent oxidoreductase [Candidatus Woesearchaeota archaeon]|jgi:pyruvate/2-oxoglutarate dehydrogenase complex dihydrolipoamide dehydrogenase (E3) component|nr:NAD(P)/FAD-dependent oxidoreductase [Candidatus Woesearchaeota archaeon]MBT4387431.1 NAD(P)/FAD-dependent oxidoreductase [Candidatus Woesearchaeota archaeon]MBT4595808.1 NAD(P)/FAD-dependent oxidoreductase [Candidatus Woesearchaeota archaeon]MBT5741343.1 NAD(P)/FAD-dependent oxidoreductase [Candidatus Woesearchaeota archaeon]MBT6505397.1 NAD(P)/FAD-dependent oxidoreductase [Candidatus Woesearchaeota archaeon]
MIYDIIIIGAGSGGLNIAMFMIRIGFKVLLIDKTDKSIGGDCLNHGCVPSKALIHCAKLAHGAKESEHFGLKVSGKIDLKKVMNYIDDKKEYIRVHENASYFRKKGIDVALGEARFVSENEVEVSGKTFKGKKIVIATGSKPRKLNVPGIENVDVINNENVFSMKKLPQKMLFIGGGPISLEISQAFNRLGVECLVIIRGNKFLPKENIEISNILKNRLEKEGIKFLFNSNPMEFTSKNECIINNNGIKTKVSFDNVFVGIGRVLNYNNLDLDKANIKTHEKGIEVNEYLQTTNPNVFLCGDIAGSYQFTHAAELHAGVILSNFFKPGLFWKKLNNDNLNWVTFTQPEIATFGINEKEIKNRKLKYKKLSLDFKDDDRAIVDDYKDGKMLLYVDNKNNLLGGSVIAPNAGEMFQELVLAKANKLKINAFFNKIYSYPTSTRVNKKIIGNLMSEKLTPFIKGLLRFLY